MADLDRLAAALAGRYTIERELGAGGMATVYLARDLRHDREVAIKVLKPELAAVIGADRFIQEIKTTAALQHPNILPLFDSGTSDSFLFYVMPFVQGETLRDKLGRDKQLGVNEAVKIAVEVADALDYAHRHGIIHRDIKPENILLHDGRPMVADFGIALAVSAASTSGRMTETGLSLGTPHYMSPEQATAEREITARSDVYSLGAVLYEMLTGAPPHSGASAQQVIMKIVMEDADLVTKHRKAVPPNVAAAVATSLAKLPADRFESARAFAAALENPAYGASDARSAAAEGEAGGALVWIRHPLSWVALALAAGALVLAGFTQHRASSGVHSLVSFDQKTFRGQAIFSGRFGADGRTIVFSSAGASGTTPRLYVIRPEYPDAQPIGPDSTQLLAISRSDQLAVLVGATYHGHRLFNGTLATLPLGGGAPRPLLTGVTDADWPHATDTLAVIHVVSGEYRVEYPIGTSLAESHGYLSDIRVSPDGQRVAYFDHPFAGDDRGTAVIVDRTRRVLARSPEYEALEGLGWSSGGKDILFSAVDSGAYQAMHVNSMDVHGTVLPELASANGLTLQDVSPQGAWLVTQDVQPYFVYVKLAGAAREQEMGWLDYSVAPIISRDAKLVAFNDESAAAGANYGAMIRKTDGSPAVRLGEGMPTLISADGQTVFAATPTSPSRLYAFPVGPGQPRRLDAGNLPYQAFRIMGMLPGGDRYVGCGYRAHELPACYLMSADGKQITQITQLGWNSEGAPLSPDGNWMLAGNDTSARLFSTAGQASRPAKGLRIGDHVLRWSPDGRELWIVRLEGLTFRVDRVDPATGNRSPLTTITPSDPSGVLDVVDLTLADDPRSYAYMQARYSSSLFVVRGVH